MSHTSGICNEDESKKSTTRHKEIIATLPKVKRGRNEWDLYQYQGFWYPYVWLEGIMLVQEEFKAHPADIVLCSYPKTGTTWLKALSFAISTRKRFGDVSTTNPLLTTVPHECIPFLEHDLVQNSDNRDPELPLLATHLSYTSLPKSILESGCKIVYICRDPKDTFVSFWHFMNNIIGNRDTKQQFCFETAFERFCQGKSVNGPFWDHVLGFWNASLESPERVLFLKYEDMKKDTLFYIRRLAQFLNQPFSMEEEDEGVPQKIMELCSFANLSRLEVNKTGKHRPATEIGINNSIYFRKGEVGDWKNHLTREMMERMDQITKQKIGSSGLTIDTMSTCMATVISHFGGDSVLGQEG